MRFYSRLFSSFLLILLQLSTFTAVNAFDPSQIHIGADRPEIYLPQLLNKNIAVVANPTSIVGNRRQHLVDFLIQHDVKVKVVFAPEHGFRGDAGAGEDIKDGLDVATGIKVISLYGKKTKPTSDDLKNIQVLVFDIQDVGVRFYTYLSTLQLVMESCADAGVKVILLDRPNPNGHYVDGPVLKTEFKSFVGMAPIPVVHGCTPGEYARMLIGEGWLNSKKKCDLTVIPISNYSHSIGYYLPVKPSPNLQNFNAIYLYPSLCFFEGTVVSVGRGTDFPFETYGYPDYKSEFDFRPVLIRSTCTAAENHARGLPPICSQFPRGQWCSTRLRFSWPRDWRYENEQRCRVHLALCVGLHTLGNIPSRYPRGQIQAPKNLGIQSRALVPFHRVRTPARPVACVSLTHSTNYR